MSEKQSISVKSAIIYGLAILVVAFVGVLLGNWYVQWRQTSNQQAPANLEDWQAVNRSSLKAGEPLPSEELLDLDGNSISTDSIVMGKITLIAMIAPGCEPCAMALKVWRDEYSNLPDDMAMVGFANGDPDDVVEYKEKYEIPFPVYCDPNLLFAQQYDLSSFPSVLGVDAEGNLALVWHGFSDRYSLIDYYNVIVNSAK